MEQEIICGQIPSKANSYAVGKSGNARHIIKNGKIRAYERSFCRQCKIYRDRLISCRFTLFVVVYEESNRYDLDNALKTLLDCLQYVRAITNDNQCAKIVAEKRIDPTRPRVVFSIEPHEPTLNFEYYCPLNNRILRPTS